MRCPKDSEKKLVSKNQILRHYKLWQFIPKINREELLIKRNREFHPSSDKKILEFSFRELKFELTRP